MAIQAVVKKGWQCNWPPGATKQDIYNEGDIIDISGHEEEAESIEALQVLNDEQNADTGDIQNPVDEEPKEKPAKPDKSKLGNK